MTDSNEGREEGPLAQVERDYEALARDAAEVIRLSDEEDRLRDSMEATELALIDAEAQFEASQLALILSVLEAAPREIPALNRWYRIIESPWQVRSGGRIFSLVPAKDSSFPKDVAELPENLTLAIVEVGA